MKKALVSPNEVVRNSNGEVIGQRIAEVRPESFAVALPFFWIDCPDECESDEWYYDGSQCVQHTE